MAVWLTTGPSWRSRTFQPLLPHSSTFGRYTRSGAAASDDPGTASTSGSAGVGGQNTERQGHSNSPERRADCVTGGMRDVMPEPVGCQRPLLPRRPPDARRPARYWSPAWPLGAISHHPTSAHPARDTRIHVVTANCSYGVRRLARNAPCAVVRVASWPLRSCSQTFGRRYRAARQAGLPLCVRQHRANLFAQL
jgi:hypothetical protein